MRTPPHTSDLAEKREGFDLQKEERAALRRERAQRLRGLARLQRQVRAAVEDCDGVFNINCDGVSLCEQLFRACFDVWRREPLEDNPHAGVLLTACWGGARFFTYTNREEPDAGGRAEDAGAAGERDG